MADRDELTLDNAESLEGLTQSKTEYKTPQQVTIPIDQWNLFKKQNEAILAKLNKKEKKRKRKRRTSVSSSDTERSDVRSECSERLKKRKYVTVESEDENRLLYDEEEGEYEGDSDAESNKIENKVQRLCAKVRNKEGDHSEETCAKPDVDIWLKQYKRSEQTRSNTACRRLWEVPRSACNLIY